MDFLNAYWISTSLLLRQVNFGWYTGTPEVIMRIFKYCDTFSCCWLSFSCALSSEARIWLQGQHLWASFSCNWQLKDLHDGLCTSITIFTTHISVSKSVFLWSLHHGEKALPVRPGFDNCRAVIKLQWPLEVQEILLLPCLLISIILLNFSQN